MGRAEQMYIGASEKGAHRESEEIASLTNVHNKKDVKKLQRFLRKELSGYDLGDKLKVDGVFGLRTKEYLKAHVSMSFGEAKFPSIVNTIESNLSKESTESKLIDEFIEDGPYFEGQR